MGIKSEKRWKLASIILLVILVVLMGVMLQSH